MHQIMKNTTASFLQLRTYHLLLPHPFLCLWLNPEWQKLFLELRAAGNETPERSMGSDYRNLFPSNASPTVPPRQAPCANKSEHPHHAKGCPVQSQAFLWTPRSGLGFSCLSAQNLQKRGALLLRLLPARHRAGCFAHAIAAAAEARSKLPACHWSPDGWIMMFLQVFIKY